MGAAMDLPDGERSETGYKQNRHDVEGDQRRDAFTRQGLCNASCGDVGIMF